VVCGRSISAEHSLCFVYDTRNSAQLFLRSRLQENEICVLLLRLAWFDQYVAVCLYYQDKRGTCCWTVADARFFDLPLVFRKEKEMKS